MPSMFPSVVGWFVLVCCIMSSCHKSFASQLNKPYGSSIHLDRGNSHGDSLYNISSRYLESYSKYFHSFGITLNTLAKITPCVFCLELISKPCPIILSPFTGAPPKLRTFLDLPNPHFLFEPFELNSCNHASPIFHGPCTFLRVRENYPRAQLFL